MISKQCINSTLSIQMGTDSTITVSFLQRTIGLQIIILINQTVIFF